MKYMPEILKTQKIKILIIASAWVLFSLGLLWGGAGRFFEISIEEPLLFNVREWLHRSPKINPNLMIMQFDEATFGDLERPYLTPKEWYSLLAAISRAKPQTIIVDKVFYDLPRKASAEYYFDQIAGIDTPLVAAVLISEENFGYRTNLINPVHNINDENINARIVNLNDFFTWRTVQKDENLDRQDSKQHDVLGPDFTDKYLYGPNHLYMELKPFKRFGHFYKPDSNRFFPIIKMGQGIEVPHLATWAAKKRTVNEESRVLLDSTVLPQEKDGSLYIDYLSPEVIKEHSKGLMGFVLSSMQGSTFSYLKDNVVVILNDMLIGTTAMSETPFGAMPTAYSLVSIVNSVMNKSWLTKVGYQEIAIVFGACIGVLLGFLGYMPLFWLGLFGVFVGMTGVSVILFSYYKIYFSFALPFLCFLGTEASVFAYYAEMKEKRLRQLRKIEDEKRKLEEELRDAAEIAKVLTPDIAPQWPFCDIKVFHKPISSTSGDWHAFENASSGNFYHFILCDIAGHGVQGAIIAATCRTVLSFMIKGDPLVLERKDFVSMYARELNSVLYHQGKGSHIATIAACTFEPRTDYMYFFSAGHPLPIMTFPQDKSYKPFKSLPSRHNPLGLCEDIEPHITEFWFGAGSQIIMYTDGIPFGMNALPLKRKLGSDWAKKLQGPEHLFNTVWELEKERTGRTPHDDVSIVWFKR